MNNGYATKIVPAVEVYSGRRSSSTAGNSIGAKGVENIIRDVGHLVCLGMTEIDRKIIEMMLAGHTSGC